MASSSSHQVVDNPEGLKTLACGVVYPGGNTLLHKFVLDNSAPKHEGNENYVNAVLLSMADVPSDVANARNAEGYSALDLAVSKNNVVMVKKLLSCIINIDVTDKDKNGITPLHAAASRGNLEIVKWLVDKGANLHAEDHNERIPLHFAAFLENFEVIKWLVGKGANLNAKLNSGETPLHLAAMGRNLELVKWLVEKGGNLHAEDRLRRTPLHSAALLGRSEMVKLLVSEGADFHAKDRKGNTPLDLAMCTRHIECAEFLKRCED